MERGSNSGRERLTQKEGEYYLELLDLGHIADQPIPGQPQLQMRDFLEICGDHARPLLVGLDSLNRNDPKFTEAQSVLRGFIGKFISAPGA